MTCIDDITEADEASSTRDEALERLRQIVLSGETMGVIGMYERAALNLGASVRETEAVLERTRA
jgi:hypothetical protein